MGIFRKPMYVPVPEDMIDKFNTVISLTKSTLKEIQDEAKSENARVIARVSNQSLGQTSIDSAIDGANNRFRNTAKKKIKDYLSEVTPFINWISKQKFS